MEAVPVGCVVMAAGSASRFGSNKLLAEFEGRTLIRRALEAVPEGVPAVVVTGYDEVAALAEEFGFSCVRNPQPELGISRTVELGVSALAERCAGIAFLTADQPLLRRDTVERLLELFRANPERIVCPVAEGRRGSPCVFPRDLFPALRALEGDRGGAQLIRRFPERVLPAQTDPRELLDVDTVGSLQQLAAGAVP